MARCLVTGHKGYIGSKLFRKLQDLGHDVIGIDLKEKYSKDIITTLREGNDGKFHPHYYNFKPEYIFHMACWPSVPLSTEQPVKTTENNIMAGSILLNFAQKVGSVKRLIYSSSSAILGNGLGPESPYALQKWTTELETKLYSSLYGLETVSLRYFNVYSKDQRPSGPYSTAICNWMHCIRSSTQPYITGDGEQRRDMVNIEDILSANIFCMNYEGLFGGHTFDVGTGEDISLNEIKEIILKHFPDLQFDYVEPREGDVNVSKANIKPLVDLGWRPKIKISEGIDDCFRGLK